MKPIIDIIDETEKHFGISKGSIYGRRRSRTIAKARHVAAYLSRTTTEYSYPEISECFLKHHTTIINSVEEVKKNFRKYEKDINHILPRRIIL